MNNIIYNGHLVRKHLGQNFLKDKFVIDSIISAINPQKFQTMVEIGPGLAALTEPMIQFLDYIIAIEIDEDLVTLLKTNPILKDKLIIYQQDVMTVNFNELSKKENRPLRLFGNLPYNISTPLIFHLFKYKKSITDMHFMLQKEIVDRLIAQPNSKTYSKLSVMTQYFCKVIPILEVSPNSFIPKPKVYSVVVQLVPHTLPYQIKDLNVLNCITTTAFAHRRKMIHNSLSNLLTTNELTEIDIDPTMRAENVSIAQYCRITNYLVEKLS